MFSYLWLSQNVEGVEEEGYDSEPQNNSANYEEI